MARPVQTSWRPEQPDPDQLGDPGKLYSVRPDRLDSPEQLDPDSLAYRGRARWCLPSLEVVIAKAGVVMTGTGGLIVES